MSDKTESSDGADVRTIKIIAAAERYVRATAERRRLTRERNVIECQRIAPIPDEPLMPGDRVAGPDNRQWQREPCWKMAYDMPDEGYAGGWGYANDEPDREEWCESCQRRQRLHDALPAARREVGAAGNSLRRSVTGSRS